MSEVENISNNEKEIEALQYQRDKETLKYYLEHDPVATALIYTYNQILATEISNRVCVGFDRIENPTDTRRRATTNFWRGFLEQTVYKIKKDK